SLLLPLFILQRGDNGLKLAGMVREPQSSAKPGISVREVLSHCYLPDSSEGRSRPFFFCWHLRSADYCSVVFSRKTHYTDQVSGNHTIQIPPLLAQHEVKVSRSFLLSLTFEVRDLSLLEMNDFRFRCLLLPLL